MGTTDDPSLVLGVLHNILRYATPDNKIRYLLGDINGLSKTAELRILKELHDQKIIKAPTYYRSNGAPYPIADDLTQTIRRNHTSFVIDSSSGNAFVHTEPVSVNITIDKKIVEKEINKIKQCSPVSMFDRALQKDGNGDFSFKGKLLLINNKPLEHNSLHYVVLDILYEKGNQDGKVPLSVMEKELNKRADNTFDLGSDKLKKAVDNAISNLFRRTKIGSGELEKILPDGRHLITTYKQNGRFAGWMMNNPSA